jgi:uncharacterized membrane protein
VAKQHAWLHGEIAQWVRDGLINQSQAEAIGERYPHQPGIAWGRLVLSSVGAIIFGLGVILLFAYNWEAMHKFAKLGVIFGSLIAAHLAAMALHRPGYPPVASEGLHALGTMLFGAGIWLIAQIYHLDEHYPNAIILWGIGALAFAWALPSLTQALMAVALVIVWQLTEVFEFEAPMHIAPWLLLLGVFPLVWRLKSFSLAGFATSALLTSITLTSLRVDDELIAPVLMFTATAAVAIGRLVAINRDWGMAHIERAFLTPGFVAIIALLYILTFPDAADSLLGVDLDSPQESMYYFIPAALSVLLWVLVVIGRARQRIPTLSWSDAIAVISLGLTLLFTLVGFGPGEWVIAAPFNLMFLTISLVLIITGARAGDRHDVTNGCLLLALLAASRYVDLFDSLLVRSLVFFLVGGILFAVGNYYSRNKEQRRQQR